jgi:hypothetical protein
VAPIIRKGKADIKVASGVFFGVKAGETATVALLTDLDEIISVDQHTFWKDGGSSPSFVCIGKGCPGCEKGDQPRFRGFMNVVTPEGDVKLWSFPISVYKSLEELEETAGSLKGMALRVRATSKGKFTATTIVPTGKRVKIDGYELIDVIEKLGPTDRDGILEMLAQTGDADEDEEPVRKPTKPQKPVDTPPAKAPAKASDSPVEPSGEDEEGEDADPWD